MKGRVLVVAGSDSGGGAGIQADLKTVMALGGYATTAVTAITAQDTAGVQAAWRVPAAMVRRQVEVVLDDIGADAVKTGMLGEAADVTAEVLRGRGLPLVVDPVMVAKGGAPLLDEGAMGGLWALLRMATVATPNVPEAEALLGRAVDDPEEAAQALRARGIAAVLLKGGHRDGAVVRDLLASVEGVLVLERPRIMTRHTHGTGCTLASGIAAGLAQGMGLAAAVERARDFVQAAIAAAPGFGRGHGPLGHGEAARGA